MEEDQAPLLDFFTIQRATITIQPRGYNIYNYSEPYFKALTLKPIHLVIPLEDKLLEDGSPIPQVAYIPFKEAYTAFFDPAGAATKTTWPKDMQSFRQVWPSLALITSPSLPCDAFGVGEG